MNQLAAHAPQPSCLGAKVSAGLVLVGVHTPEFGSAYGRISRRFHARDLHLVMGPARQGPAVRFRVTLDGAPPGGDCGLDVDGSGLGVAREQRLFQLIRQAGRIRERTFEIEFLDPAVEAFAFTFG